MNTFIWFLLLIRAIGILLIGLSLPAAISLIGWFGQLPSAAGALDSYILYVAAQVLAHFVQLFFGLYLLIGGNRVIRYCARDVMRPLERCIVCGYDLRGLTISNCPECGIDLERPSAPLAAADSPDLPAPPSPPPPPPTPGGGS
jgi:hypothetical protein